MKLEVRIIEAPHVPGKRALALFADGVMLPCQKAARLETAVGSAPPLTVDFVVNGRELTMAA